MGIFANVTEDSASEYFFLVWGIIAALLTVLIGITVVYWAIKKEVPKALGILTAVGTLVYVPVSAVWWFGLYADNKGPEDIVIPEIPEINIPEFKSTS